jgi:DNA-binding CsgD family transcriptional regulator
LTPREWEVLHLLRAGLTNRDIAEELGISLAGAKYHVSEIISKLGVSSREEAAAWRPRRQRLTSWMTVPVAVLHRLPKAAGAATAAAAFVALIALGAALSGAASSLPETTSSVAATRPPDETSPSAAVTPQAAWEFQGPTSALPRLPGHVTSAGEVKAISGEVLSIDFINPGVREIALRPETEVFGAIGHSVVIDSDHARLHLGDGVLIRYDSEVPSDPSTWRVLQVVRNYFKYMTGRVVAVGADYLDVLNIEPPLREPGAPDVLTRVYVDPNARIETASIDGGRFPPAPLAAVEARPGMQATFEGVIADDGSPVAIWLQLY